MKKSKTIFRANKNKNFFILSKFVPAKALQLQARREASLKNDIAVEISRKLAEVKLQIRMNELLGEEND